MDTSTYIVPFTLAQSDNFLTESSGLLRLEGRTLVMEYQTRDAVMGVIKSGVKEIRLDLADLQSISFKKGLFSNTLKLQSRVMRTFEKVPGSQHGMLELAIKRGDRQTAEYLVSAANLRVSELRIESMGELED